MDSMAASTSRRLMLVKYFSSVAQKKCRRRQLRSRYVPPSWYRTLSRQSILSSAFSRKALLKCPPYHQRALIRSSFLPGTLAALGEWGCVPQGEPLQRRRCYAEGG